MACVQGLAKRRAAYSMLIGRGMIRVGLAVPATAEFELVAEFEIGLATATAQIYDRLAGDLRAAGGQGGPDAILAQPFYIGINDNLGDSLTPGPPSGPRNGSARASLGTTRAFFSMS